MDDADISYLHTDWCTWVQQTDLIGCNVGVGGKTAFGLDVGMDLVLRN